MFKCQMCGKVTEPKEKQYKKIIKTRSKTYHNLNKYGKEKISKGSETVKEINVCEECANK